MEAAWTEESSLVIATGRHLMQEGGLLNRFFVLEAPVNPNHGKTLLRPQQTLIRFGKLNSSESRNINYIQGKERNCTTTTIF